MSDGVVQWTPGLRWATSCEMDLYYFPFDTQVCSVHFMNWMYRAEFAQFIALSDSVDLTLVAENQEWQIMDTFSWSNNITLDVKVGILQLPTVGFQLHMRRQPKYYVMNIVIPCVTLSFLSIFVFILPTESGEKVSFGITVLLSFSIILLMVNDITPRGGKTMPIFCKISLSLSTSYIIMMLSQLPVVASRTGYEAYVWQCLHLVS